MLAELDSLGLLASPSNPHPRRLQWEDLSRLTYLNAAIKVLLPPPSQRVFPMARLFHLICVPARMCECVRACLIYDPCLLVHVGGGEGCVNVYV